jgi:hypothetical protein
MDYDDGKRAREETKENTEVDTNPGKRLDIEDTDWSLWDVTPQLSQVESSTLSDIASESVIENPTIELRPGYTPRICGLYIAAWNGMCLPTAALHNGCTAAQLLQNGLMAEKRIVTIAGASSAPETNGYEPSVALKALDAVHREVNRARAAHGDATDQTMVALTHSEQIRQQPEGSI